MFDDQPLQKGAGAIPGNLPVSEPEDMFGAMPDASPPLQVAPVVPPPRPLNRPVASAPMSAVAAGALKPALPPSPPPVVSTLPVIDEPVASGQKASTAYPARGPVFSRYLMIFAAVVLGGGVLGGGGWYVYGLVAKQANMSGIEVPAVTPLPTENVGATTPDTTPPPEVQPPPNQEVLFGGPKDSDGDGLNDDDEVGVYNTDPHNWDTDGDTLSDYDEVIVWKTDPRKKDTDGDGFVDGEEVKNGYNPSGPGKIFEPPKTP